MVIKLDGLAYDIHSFDCKTPGYDVKISFIWSPRLICTCVENQITINGIQVTLTPQSRGLKFFKIAEYNGMRYDMEHIQDREILYNLISTEFALEQL